MVRQTLPSPLVWAIMKHLGASEIHVNKGLWDEAETPGNSIEVITKPSGMLFRRIDRDSKLARDER